LAPAPEKEEASPVDVSAERLAELAGTYYSAARAAVREITYAGGRLRFEGLDLVPLGENLFAFEVEPETQVEFMPAPDGSVAGLKTLTPSGDYGYDRVEAVTPAAEMLAEYAGRYYSPELDIYWTLVASDGNLVAQRRKYVDSVLAPLFRDAFRDDWTPLMGYPAAYLVVFARDEHGTVTGLRVSGNRVRHVAFVREGA
jgi:hypothetical protein